MNTPFFYIILNIQISLVSAQTDNFDFLDQICPKSISSQKQKMGTSPWKSAYSNYSSYKISAQTDHFEFLDQILQKSYFHLKREQTVQRLEAFAFCVVNAIQLLFLNILKI